MPQLLVGRTPTDECKFKTKRQPQPALVAEAVAYGQARALQDERACSE